MRRVVFVWEGKAEKGICLQMQLWQQAPSVCVCVCVCVCVSKWDIETETSSRLFLTDESWK